MILSLIVLGMLSALSGVADETLKMWTNIATKSAKAHNGGN
jgi:Flp pilus assembly pilin Flp